MDGYDPDGPYVFKPLLGLEGEELPRMDAARHLGRFCSEWGADVAATEEIGSRVAILHYPAITREMMSAALAPIQMAIKGSNRAIDEAMPERSETETRADVARRLDTDDEPRDDA